MSTQKVISLRLSFFCAVMLLTACSNGILQEPYVKSKNAVAVHTHKQNLELMQARTTATKKILLFQTILTQVRHLGVDMTVYQHLFDTDRAVLNNAHSVDSLSSAVAQIDQDMTTNLPLAQALAYYEVQQFHQAVTYWGNSHLYVDGYNGKSYPLDYEYAALPDDYGAGSDLDNALQTAETLSDYQSIIALVQNDQEMLKALSDDAQDLAPWNQPHATDQRLMQYFRATQGLVIVVSFYEQTLRLYQDGQLIKSYQVVTGLYERPSPPGYWQIHSHDAQSLFTSFEAPDSPLYFPPTQVYWAMGFADPSLGYFIHASPWRTYYGQGNNFPHNDPHNDNTESRNGSHGCVNLPLDQAQQLYQQVSDGTVVILY